MPYPLFCLVNLFLFERFFESKVKLLLKLLLKHLMFFVLTILFFSIFLLNKVFVYLFLEIIKTFTLIFSLHFRNLFFFGYIVI